jgi:hypothetical protein
MKLQRSLNLSRRIVLPRMACALLSAWVFTCPLPYLRLVAVLGFSDLLCA